MKWQLALALLLALHAAYRLLTWERHIQSDVRWLAEFFGPGANDRAIAVAHAWIDVVLSAGAALVLVLPFIGA